MSPHPNIKLLDHVAETLGGLAEEITAGDMPVRRYLADQMTQLLAIEDFRQALPGHLDAAGTSAGRSATVLKRMEAIAAFD